MGDASPSPGFSSSGERLSSRLLPTLLLLSAQSGTSACSSLLPNYTLREWNAPARCLSPTAKKDDLKSPAQSAQGSEQSWKLLGALPPPAVPHPLPHPSPGSGAAGGRQPQHQKAQDGGARRSPRRPRTRLSPPHPNAPSPEVSVDHLLREEPPAAPSEGGHKILHGAPRAPGTRPPPGAASKWVTGPGEPWAALPHPGQAGTCPQPRVAPCLPSGQLLSSQQTASVGWRGEPPRSLVPEGGSLAPTTAEIPRKILASPCPGSGGLRERSAQRFIHPSIHLPHLPAAGRSPGS